MTWNPHEIVTLDDQPEDNELCRCGHSRSPHHELGVGKCDLVADGRPCQCSRYQQQSRYEDGEGYELGRAYGSSKPDNEKPCRYCHCQDNHNPDCPISIIEAVAAERDEAQEALVAEQRINENLRHTWQPPSKPMRIRCMELPGEINPDTNELTTPFVIVLDRVTGGPLDLETGNAIALNTGARGVLAFEQEIQIGEDD